MQSGVEVTGSSARYGVVMELSRYSVAMGVAGMLTVMTASMLVWLLATEPVALATAVDDRDLTELAYAVGRAIIDGLTLLVEYL